MADEPYNPSPIGNPSVLARRNWWQTKLVILIGKHTPKCREMIRILSQSMDEPMPLVMRIKKRVHYLICCWCQRYEEQLLYMRKTARAFAEHADESSDVAVTEEMKERWKQVLQPSARVVQQWSEKKGEVAGKFEGSQMRWRRGILPVAALAVVMLAFLFTWTRSIGPRPSLADFRDEMVSFAKIDPSLEMKSNQLSDLTSWLETSHSMSGVVIPAKLKNMEPVGCRVLRYRAHDVGLICFRRANGKLLHLFVMNQEAFPRVSDRSRPKFSGEGEWMTAAWSEGEHIYLLAAQSDQPTLESYLKL
jgi:hypothetical protein